MFPITILSTLRMGVGLALLAVPSLTGQAFLLAQPPVASTIITRLAGSRDLILGALTLHLARGSRSQTKGQSAKPRPDHAVPSSPLLDAEGASLLHSASNSGDSVMRAVLAANIAVDAIDILSCLWCYGEGNLSLGPTLLIGGGVTTFLGLGIVSYTMKSWAVGRRY